MVKSRPMRSCRAATAVPVCERVRRALTATYTPHSQDARGGATTRATDSLAGTRATLVVTVLPVQCLPYSDASPRRVGDYDRATSTTNRRSPPNRRRCHPRASAVARAGNAASVAHFRRNCARRISPDVAGAVVVTPGSKDYRRVGRASRRIAFDAGFRIRRTDGSIGARTVSFRTLRSRSSRVSDIPSFRRQLREATRGSRARKFHEGISLGSGTATRTPRRRRRRSNGRIELAWRVTPA